MSWSWLTIGVVESLERSIEERAKAKGAELDEDGWRTLRYPAIFFFLIACLGMLLALGIFLIAWFSDETPGMKLFMYIESAVFALMAVSLLIEDRAVVWIGSRGIGAKSPWRWWSVELRWEEVEELRWGGRSLLWYRIKGPGGTIRVHQWLGGRIIEDYFARYLSEELARDAVAKANLVKRYKWREFWKKRVKEAHERLEE